MECKQIVSGMSAYLQHVQSHQQTQCEKCYKVLKDEDALAYHQKVECQATLAHIQSEDMIKCSCPFCHANFTSEQRLNSHLEISEELSLDKSKLNCPYCSKKFEKNCQLVRHKKKSKFICKPCHIHYRTQSNFVSHIEKEHKCSDACKSCYRRFASVEKLQQHIDYNKKMTEMIDLKCFQCGMHFDSKDELEEHSRTYEQCNYCGAHFPPLTESRHDYLHIHLKNEHGIGNQDNIAERQRNVCRHCSTVFDTAWELSAHVKQVLKDEGALICTWERDTNTCLRCGFSYDHYGRLRKHLRSYCFECYECNKHFTNNRALWRHSQVCMKNSQTIIGEGLGHVQESNSPVSEVDIKNIDVHKNTTRISENENGEESSMEDTVLDQDSDQKIKRRKKHPPGAPRDGGMPVRRSVRNKDWKSSPISGNQRRGRVNKEKRAKSSKLVCKYCKMVFQFPHRIKSHIKRFHVDGSCNWTCVGSTHNEKKFKCHYCWKLFPRASAVAYHVMMSEKDMTEELSTCKDCGQNLMAKCQVDVHPQKCGQKTQETSPNLLSDEAVKFQHPPNCVKKSRQTSQNLSLNQTGKIRESKLIPEEESDIDENTHDWVETTDDQIPTSDTGIIQLDSNKFYKVKFPQGMSAKVVSGDEETSAYFRKDNEETGVNPCIIPVISLESLQDVSTPASFDVFSSHDDRCRTNAASTSELNSTLITSLATDCANMASVTPASSVDPSRHGCLK